MRIFTTPTNARISEITASLAKEHKSLESRPCYVFCEDKNTLSLETEIARVCGGSFNITVTSLSRYLSSSGKKAMTKIGSVLTVFKIMQENQDKLKKLKINSNPQIAKNLYELIAQLKSAKIKAELLNQICDKVGGAFSLKLKDIAVIYGLYEDYLSENGLADNNNLYSLLPEIILKDQKLKNSKIIIAGFSSVTKQILDCFLALSSVGDCDFVVLKGNGAFYNNETYRSVTEMFSAISEVEDTLPLSAEARVIKDCLFNPNNKKVRLESDKVSVLQCADIYGEAEAVAKRIRYEVVRNGLRYKDFCIATSDLQQYAKVFETVFSDYEIPVYADNSQTAYSHPLMRLILAVLESVSKNYKMDAIFNLVRQRSLFDREEAEAFEKYVLKNAVYPKQLKSPFITLDLEDVIAENVRVKLSKIRSVFPKKGSVSDYIRAIKDTCSNACVEERLNELADKLKTEQAKTASYNKQFLKSAQAVFDELESVVGDKVLKIEEFKTLIVSAFDSADVSVLPLYNDNVFMGDFKSVKQRRAKVLFAVGLTDEVPFCKQDVAILTDKDLICLDGYACRIEPKIQLVNKRERENVGVCLMSFEKSLYLSYPIRDLTCKQKEKSEIISYFEKAFKCDTLNYVEAEKVNLNKFSDRALTMPYLAKSQAIKRFVSDLQSFIQTDNSAVRNISSFYHSQKDNKNLDVLIEDIVNPKKQERFDKEITSKLSASVIESYFKCPYSCFLKYNIQVKDDVNGEVESLSYGNILHKALELFVKKYKQAKSSGVDNFDVEKTSTQIFDEIINDEEYCKYLNKPKYVENFQILKKECVKMCRQIYEEYQSSAFEPFGEEVFFGNPDNGYPAITVKTDKGEVKLRGVVDRIDKYENNLRIIDYKTGNAEKKAGLESFYSGCNIQLYLYANAFLKKGEISGAYYYGVENKYKDSPEKQQSFFGNTVFDEDILLASDKNYRDNGNMSPAYGIKKSRSEYKSVLSKGEMNAFIKYAKQIATVGANEIAEGNIVVSPHKNSCTYCDYMGVCGFDLSNGEGIREIGDVEKNTIVNAVVDNND